MPNQHIRKTITLIRLHVGTNGATGTKGIYSHSEDFLHGPQLVPHEKNWGKGRQLKRVPLNGLGVKEMTGRCWGRAASTNLLSCPLLSYEGKACQDGAANPLFYVQVLLLGEK